MNDYRLYVVALCICLAHTIPAQACDKPIAQPLKLVSLWNNEAASTLENLNQIDTLCSSENYSAACLEKSLSPSSKALPVYHSPEDAQPFGAFLIRYMPGEGGNAAYIPLPNNGGNIATVTLDEFDNDWGYGPYFHQTMLDEKNGWYNIAVPDSPTKTGWIQLSHPDILSFSKGDAVSFNGKPYTILETNKDIVRLRDEQPADMWCDAGTPPPLKKFTPITVPMTELYDEGCHLRMKKSYTRGC